MTAAAPLLLRLVLAALAGAVAAFGLAPWELWWATVAGMAVLPMLLNASPRDAALTGWAFGTGWFAHALAWIVEPFFVDAARHGWMAPFAVVFLCGGLALFWGAAFWTAARLSRPGAARIALLVLTWTLAETLRGYIFTGFPWAAPGQIWVDTPFAALLAWTGPIGLDLLTLAALLPLGLLFTLRSPFATLPAILAAALGFLAHNAQPQVTPSGHTVRILQPNIPQDEKWDPDRIRAHFQRQVGYTAALPRPDLVVWPETAVPVLLDEAGPALEAIALAANGAEVATGIQRWQDGRWYNALVRLDGAGNLGGVYDKHHLVPFGEYIPFGRLLKQAGITALADNFGDGFSSGPGPRVIDFGPVGKGIPLICYEAVFARDSHSDDRADFLLQVTNDAWFGTRSGPFQHLAQARMRAIEQGLPLIRSANTGISALIDPRGQVIDSLPMGESGYLDAALPAPLPATLYARTGDTPAMIGLIVLFLTLTGLIRAGNRARAIDHRPPPA